MLRADEPGGVERGRNSPGTAAQAPRVGDELGCSPRQLEGVPTESILAAIEPDRGWNDELARALHGVETTTVPGAALGRPSLLLAALPLDASVNDQKVTEAW